MFIGELVVGIIEGAAGLAQLLAESLGFAAGHLSKKPKEGESRWRRVFVAFVPLVAAVLIVAGIFTFWQFQEHRRAAMVQQTKESVEQLINQLTKDCDDAGRLVQVDADQIKTLDAWDQPLRVEYEQQAFRDVVTVRSIGPDGEAHTLDDIRSRQGVLIPKAIGRAAIEKVGKTIWDRD